MKDILVVLILGFSSGLPIALIGGTLQAWMKELGFTLSAIGLFGWVTFPYTIKFLWSPLLDIIQLRIGRFKGKIAWIILLQLMLAIFLTLVALTGEKSATLLVFECLILSFLSATQDIAIDGYRAELIRDHKIALGASVAVLGYRLAMIASGAGALILAEYYSWQNVYLTYAVIFLFLIPFCVFYPETNVSFDKKENYNQKFIIKVVSPLVEFYRRKKYAIEILLFVLLYKLGEALAMSLNTPFLLELGYQKSDIGKIAKGVGLVCSILGAICGGSLVTKIGLKKGLFYFGIIQALSILTFLLLLNKDVDLGLLGVVMGVENFANGLGNAVYVGFLTSLCSIQLAGSQYALLSSLAAMPREFLKGFAGFMVIALGWHYFYLFSFVMTFPALILILIRWEKWEKNS